MSYIQPNSKIWLLKNVPLKPDYEHTILFSSTNIQLNYFIQGGEKTRFSPLGFDAQSYQRVNAGVIRLALNADIAVMQGYNYLVFRNDEYTRNPEYTPELEYKYYYAFITEIVYVNNNVCEIRYSIDVMQSFMFDYTMHKCFVIREHTETDLVGEHTLPEPIEAGKYVYDTPMVMDTSGNWTMTDTPFYFGNNYVMIASTFTFTVSGDVWTPVKTSPKQYDVYSSDSKFRGFLYNGLFYNVFMDSMSVNNFLNHAVDVINGDYSAGIAAIFMVPAIHVPVDNSTYPPNIYYPQAKIIDRAVRFDDYWTLPGYVKPKNNKLYTSPYTMFQVTTPSGESMTFKQEQFNINQKAAQKYFIVSESFVLSACPQMDFSLGARTSQFDGIPGNTYNNQRFSNNFRLTISNFPMCSYYTDAYQAWLAQNQGKNSINLGYWQVQQKSNLYSARTDFYNNTISNLFQLAGDINRSLSIGGAVNSGPYTNAISVNRALASEGIAARNLISNYTNVRNEYNYKRDVMNEEIRLASNLPDIPTSMDANSLDVSIRNFCFRLQIVRLDSEYAQIVDDYFTKYGYNVQTLKVPSRDNRPHFTFVQTKRAVATGPITHNYLSEICACYDAGITFWKFDPYNPENFFMNYDVNNAPQGASPEEWHEFLEASDGKTVTTRKGEEIEVHIVSPFPD